MINRLGIQRIQLLKIHLSHNKNKKNQKMKTLQLKKEQPAIKIFTNKLNLKFQLFLNIRENNNLQINLSGNNLLRKKMAFLYL